MKTHPIVLFFFFDIVPLIKANIVCILLHIKCIFLNTLFFMKQIFLIKINLFLALVCSCLKILLPLIKIQISNSPDLHTNCILILLPLTVELHVPFVLIQKFHNSNHIILLHLVNELQICPMTFHMLMIRGPLSMMMILPMINFNQTTILHLVHNYHFATSINYFLKFTYFNSSRNLFKFQNPYELTSRT